jgi:hypothetical protein
MHAFKDTAGREWFLKANYLTYERVKAGTGVALYDLATESRESLTQLADALTLGAVIWLMVQPQAEAADITPEQFYEAFDGTVAVEAHDALLNEMIFFCHPRQRMLLERAYTKVKRAADEAANRAEQLMPAAEAEMDIMLERWISGNLGSSSPASSASVRTIGPSENSSGPSRAASATSGTTQAPSSRRSRKSTAIPRSAPGHMTPQKSTP